MRRFAMLTHFMGISSKENFIHYPFYPFVLKFLPQTWIKKSIPYLPPHIVVKVQNITSIRGEVTEGYAIMCPLLPEQFFYFDEDVVLNKIIKCCKKAKSLDVDIVGLAAFTSVVGNEGEFVANNININVTSGNTYTAFLAIDSILKAVSALDVDTARAKLVILGATGDIGSICTKILSKTFRNLTLVARDLNKIKQLISLLPSENSIKIDQTPDKAVREGDVILSVTSSVIPLIDIKSLRPGTIFCDVSIPPSIKKQSENFREDVLIYDGGKAQVPNSERIISKKWHQLFPNGVIFGCLAETILLALEEKIQNFSIGRGFITEEKIVEISRLALKHGFKTSPFAFGSYLYKEDDLNFIKKIIHKRC